MHFGLVKFIEGVGHSWHGVVNGPFGGFGAPYSQVSDFYPTDHVCEQTTSLDGTKSTPVLIISPNPFSDFIEVSANGNRRETISFYSASGVLVSDYEVSGSLVIDTRTLQAGIYFIRQSERIYKLVKN